MRPVSYPIPTDGPVGGLLASAGRQFRRVGPDDPEDVTYVADMDFVLAGQE